VSGNRQEPQPRSCLSFGHTRQLSFLLCNYVPQLTTLKEKAYRMNRRTEKELQGKHANINLEVPHEELIPVNYNLF
jgi:hypothetical protein